MARKRQRKVLALLNKTVAGKLRIKRPKPGKVRVRKRIRFKNSNFTKRVANRFPQFKRG